MAESTGKYSKTYMASNGKKATISIWTGEDEEAFAGSKEGEEDYEASNSLAFDSQMKLAGVIDSEITRYKEKLLNKHFDNLNNDIVVPTAPTGSPLIEQFKIKNEFAKQKETREILMANVDKEYKKTDIQIKLKDLQLKESFNSMFEASLIMQGNFYIQNEKMIAGFERINQNLGELRGTLSSLNSKIAKGVESQILVNQKQLDKLIQELEKNISIDGKNINALELEKMKNQELYTSASDDNNFLLNEGLEAVEDILTDGFDLEFNPLIKIMEIVQDQFKKEMDEIQVKYNIEGVK